MADSRYPKSPFVRLEYGVVISGTMVVERMPGSSSFDNQQAPRQPIMATLSNKQQQQQQQQQQAAAPPPRQQHIIDRQQQQQHQRAVDSQFEDAPRADEDIEEEDEDEEEEEQEEQEGEEELNYPSGGEYAADQQQRTFSSPDRDALRKSSSSSLRRAVLVRQDAELPTIGGNETDSESASKSGTGGRPSTTSTHQQQQQQQQQQPPPLPPHPTVQIDGAPMEPPPYSATASPSPNRITRGHTPVFEFEEPDDLFFIVKELVLTERTYLRDLELAAIRLPAVLMSFSRHHSSNRQSAAVDPTSDSERSCASEGSSNMANTGLGCLCSFASSTLHPLLNFHRAFAAELESRLCAWTASCSAVNEGSSIERVSSQRPAIILQIGDILMSLTTVLHLYRSYLARLLSLLWSPVVGADLTQLTEVLTSGHTDQILAAFYISPSLLLCRPAHRLLAYRHLLATYVAHLSPTHPDSLDASALLARLSDLLAGSSSVLSRVDSARILLELRAALPGQPTATSPAGGPTGGLSIPLAACSDFVRLGCLHKLTRKGYQPRLFLLLSDSLLYAARSAVTSSGPNANPIFRLHSQIPLRELTLVGSNEAEPGRLQLAETTTGRRLHLVATSIGDWRRWLADLRATISMASAGTTGSNSLPRRRYLSPAQQAALTGSVDSGASVLANVSPPLITASETSSTSPDVHTTQSLMPEATSPQGYTGSDTEGQQQHQSQQHSGGSTCGGVSLAHVCWHRALSLGVDDIRLSGSGAQLSSYLLRKFKSAPGWQKLWVVLAADCALHFFKSCYDPTPLASLPLLGYTVSPVLPNRAESPVSQYQQQLVFRLQFKSHVYLFRAESRYTYSRWLDTVRCATLAWWTAEQGGAYETEGADEAAAAAAYILQQEENEAIYGDYMQQDLDHEQQA